jgi:uncharacterized protein (TIGR03437 family)
MTRRGKIVLAKAAMMVGVLPVLLWAHVYGPDPGYSGVPTENGGATCTTCHTGTLNNPANKGSVTVTFSNRMTYTPGVAQQLSVTIADPAPTQKAAGFQLTARLASSPNTMAGTFATVDTNTQVLCSTPSLSFGAVTYQVANGLSCKASQPLEYIEQTGTQTDPLLSNGQYGPGGYENSITHGLPYTYTFMWTPPATNVGNVTIYVAGNAGVGNPPTDVGDHIYATTYTLTPSAGGAAPTIASSGVVNGASFQAGIVPNSWITIQGGNLASVTDTWANAIVNGKLPTTLDGVSVSVGGQPAYVYYISPTQINVLAPNVGPGSMQVTVTNSNGTSGAVTATSQTFQPAFFQWPGNYAVATRQDYSYAVANGTFPSLTTTPAKPGDVIILWGTGFGPANPTPPVGVQVPATQTYSTANPVTVMIGGNAATVYGTALASGFVGLYQVAIQVPQSIANGNYPVVATVNGASSLAATVITVHN